MPKPRSKPAAKPPKPVSARQAGSAHAPRSSEPVTPAASYLGVRLNVTDFMRATEQTAVLMSLLAGRNLKGPKLYRAWATTHLLSYLRYAFCRPRYSHRADEEETSSSHVGTAWRTALASAHVEESDAVSLAAAGGAERSRKRVRYREPGVPKNLDQLKLDVIAVPLDGATCLHRGTPGTVSAVAAGEPGCFVEDAFADGEPLADRYFVVVANRFASGQHFASVSSRTPRSTDEFVNHVLDGLPLERDGRCCGPTLAWVEPPADLDLVRPQALDGRRFESLSGSGIAAAIAALRPSHHIDLMLLYAKPHHLIAAALAAKTLKGSLLAIPTNTAGIVSGQHRVRSESDFILKKRAFLVLTGVTRTRILEPVLFPKNGRVRTHSMTLSLTTGSVRDTEHDFAVSEALFRDQNGNSARASTLMKQFLTSVASEASLPRGLWPVPIPALDSDQEVSRTSETQDM